MLNIKSMESTISQMASMGIESFLKAHSLFEKSDIDNIFHYKSLLPEFETFIYFKFKRKKISFIFSDKKITLNDFLKNKILLSSNYNFRDDISRVKIANFTYITVNGRLDLSENPIVSIDAKGNIQHPSEIEVKSVVVELHEN